MHGVGGAARVQLIGFSEEEGKLVRSVIGYACLFDPQATSAFSMELLALKTGLKLIVQALRQYYQ